MYIKRIKEKDSDIWYLCDDKNEIFISGEVEILKLLEGYELGSYDYLFNQEMLFQWKKEAHIFNYQTD